MSLTAADIMSRNVITVEPEMELIKLAEVLAIHKVGGVPVVEKSGRLVGVVSQSDLVAQNKNPSIPRSITLFDWVIYLDSMDKLKSELDKMAGVLVRDIMTKKVLTVTPESSMAEVADLMTEKKVHTIPVLKDGEIVGVIGKLDIVRSLLG